MIINKVLPDGRIRPCLKDEIKCPFAMHYHGGDSIEIELEMIICRDKAEKAMKKMGW